MHCFGATIGSNGKTIPGGDSLLLGTLVHISVRVGKREQRMAKQGLQLAFILLNFMGLLFGCELAQAGVSQGMTTNFHMTAGGQRLDLLTTHQ